MVVLLGKYIGFQVIGLGRKGVCERKVWEKMRYAGQVV